MVGRFVPLPRGAKTDRVERKIDTIKSRERTTKSGTQYSLHYSFVPNLVKNTRVMITTIALEAMRMMLHHSVF